MIQDPMEGGDRMGGIRLIFKTQGFVEKPYRVREMDQSSAEELREKLEYILKGIYKREESVTTALVSKKYPLEKCGVRLSGIAIWEKSVLNSWSQTRTYCFGIGILHILHKRRGTVNTNQ